MVGRPRAAWTDQAKLCAPQAPAACAGPAPVPAQTGGESGDRTDRLLKLLETANIKLASVVTDVFGVSGLLMLRALVEGRATPSETAQLARGCQRSPNNPHGWSLKIPHPPHEGGHRHDGDIVDGRDGGHGRHWPRGHTPRGGTHGSGGLLARGASAVPRGEAVEVPVGPGVGARPHEG